jgi:hypothetical protein
MASRIRNPICRQVADRYGSFFPKIVLRVGNVTSVPVLVKF